MAEVAQHLGDAAHADAADPDEVNAARIERQRPLRKSLHVPVDRGRRHQ